MNRLLTQNKSDTDRFFFKLLFKIVLRTKKIKIKQLQVSEKKIISFHHNS